MTMFRLLANVVLQLLSRNRVSFHISSLCVKFGRMKWERSPSLHREVSSSSLYRWCSPYQGPENLVSKLLSKVRDVIHSEEAREKGSSDFHTLRNLWPIPPMEARETAKNPTFPPPS